jgi:hypothetical protein
MEFPAESHALWGPERQVVEVSGRRGEKERMGKDLIGERDDEGPAE